MFFFFKQKTAYEIGLGIPAEPLFRSHEVITFLVSMQAAYANLHTDQERDYFMQRYHDVISSFGGKTSRSEERRVGKECRSRWALHHKKKKKREEWMREAQGETLCEVA